MKFFLIRNEDRSVYLFHLAAVIDVNPTIMKMILFYSLGVWGGGPVKDVTLRPPFSNTSRRKLSRKPDGVTLQAFLYYFYSILSKTNLNNYL